MNPVSVSTILKEGMVINTRIGINSTWHENVVYKCEGTTVCIGLIKGYLENVVMNGTKLLIKYTNEYFEYLFEGIVTQINTVFPPRIHIQINKAEEIINTRVFPRYNTYLASTLKLSWNEDPLFSIVTNISLGGIAFTCKQKLEYGDECSVYIHLSGDRIICCIGKVIRRVERGEYLEYSMQFTEMDEHNSNILAEHMDYLSQEYEKQRNHFFEKIKNFL